MNTNSLRSRAVKHFQSRLFIGISILVPIMILASLIGWVVNKIDDFVRPLFYPVPFISDLILGMPGMGIIPILIITYLVGELSFNRIGRFGIKLLNRIHGYKELKKLVSMLFGLDKSNIESNRTVVVEYPSKDIGALGLLMSELSIDGKPYCLVFIATPPLPNNGNLTLFPRHKVNYALIVTGEDKEESYFMTRAEYIKYVISAGTVLPSNIKTKPVEEK